jgi:hypothetical protein
MGTGLVRCVVLIFFCSLVLDAWVGATFFANDESRDSFEFAARGF